MKIQVITTYFKEEILTPLFMLHYADWVDEITTITAQMPGGLFDDGLKKNWINEAIARSSADWVIVVDYDEFVFPVPFAVGQREILEKEPSHIIMCEMVRVWRHHTDKDIDPTIPPLAQRKHGAPDHAKPCIFRPQGVSLEIGNHSANIPAHYVWGKPWSAAHWANADICFGIKRSMTYRQHRLSQSNMDHSWGIVQEWHQPGYLEAQYELHKNDPQILP